MTEPHVTIIEARRGWAFANLWELVRYHELLAIICWRDVLVRYKQSAIGIAWAIVQPLGTMIVFSVVFGRLVGVASDGIPYPIFSYCGLLPWMFFQRAVVQGSGSLVNFSSVLTKVYFPTLIAPVAAILTAFFDFLIAFSVLLLMMLWYGILPDWPVLLIPAFLLLGALAALGVSLWLSVANVEFRDVQQVMPFLVQVWMFVTPVVYPTSAVPAAWRPLYALNPMATVVDGFRWGLLNGPAPELVPTLVSVAVVAALILSGLLIFDRFTRTFVDRI